MAKLLTLAEMDAGLSALSGWSKEAGRPAIRKRFTFGNFSEAFGFMSRVALAAEKLDHHPEWSNVYRHVDVVLTTHDAGGVTELDLMLASTMDSIASAMPS